MTTPSRIYGISPLSQAAIGGDITTGISAAGTTAATATVLTTDLNYVSTCAAAAGVILPTGEIGKTVTVSNNGSGLLLVYPATGGTINKLAANLPFTIQPSTSGTFTYSSATAVAAVSAFQMLPSQVTTITAGTSQLTAAQMVGASVNYIVLTVQGAATFATPSAANIFAAVPNASSGMTFICHIVNQNSGTATISAGTGVTINGTLAVQTATVRSFHANVDSGTSITFTNVSPT